MGVSVEASVRQRGLSVVAVEVALDTGLTVEDAEGALAVLMADCAGSYELKGEGSKARVRYAFPADFERRLAARRWKTRLSNGVAPFARVGFDLFRVSVGVFVLFSLLLVAVLALAVFLAFLYAQASQKRSSSWGHTGTSRLSSSSTFGRALGLLHESFRTWNELTFCYWCAGGSNPFFRPVYFGFGGGPMAYARGLGHVVRHRQQQAPRRQRPMTRAVITDGVIHAVPIAEEEEEEQAKLLPEAPVDDPEKGEEQETNPLASIYAFVFGPPSSEDVEAEGWRVVGAACAEDGCVTAERLAPLLPEPPTSLDARLCERAAAPAVAHFSGKPVAVEDGSGVVFEFPLLLNSRRRRISVLVEPRSQFAGIGDDRCLICATLGVANLAGVLWLRMVAFHPRGYLPPSLNSSMSVLRKFSFVLLGYAVLFLAIPITRAGFLKVHNRRVDRRNALRQQRSEDLKRQLADPLSSLALKTRFANNLALALRS